jgi:plastocyanin
VRRHRLIGRLIAAALLVAGCTAIAGADGTARSPAPSGAIEVAVEAAPGGARAFEPRTIVVPAGALVHLIFRNGSSEIHNLAFPEMTELRTRTLISPGESDALTFQAPGPGIHPFVCTVHPGMTGTLVVTAD